MGRYYDEIELRQILVNTRSASSDPYKLFTAFAINSVADTFLDDEEEETLDDLWGKEIDKRAFDRLLSDTLNDFFNAIDNGLQVRVFGSPCSIRNGGKLKREKLSDVFDFDVKNGCYVISKTKIRNLDDDSLSYSDKKERLKDTKLYLKKITYLTETDKDGWYQLTDMEAAWYCWQLYLLKCRENVNVDEFEKKYGDSFNLSLKEVLSCTESGKLESLLSIRADKVRAWNKKHNQTSIIDRIDNDKAESFGNIT